MHVWWVDERFVPLGHPERNDGALEEVFAQLPIPSGNIHRMPSPDNAADVDDGARKYADELARFAENGHAMPLFDVVLLGMGPDGHVASLFPQHAGLEVDSGGVPTTRTISVTDSPKPPSERISLTMAAINHTRKLWVAAWGAEKAPAIAAGVEGAKVQDIPAAGVRGREETLWLTDIPGATALKG